MQAGAMRYKRSKPARSVPATVALHSSKKPSQCAVSLVVGATLDVCDCAVAHIVNDSGDIVVCWLRQLDGNERAIAQYPDGVGNHGMQMNVRAETRTEALNRHDSAGMRALHENATASLCRHVSQYIRTTPYAKNAAALAIAEFLDDKLRIAATGSTTHRGIGEQGRAIVG